MPTVYRLIGKTFKRDKISMHKQYTEANRKTKRLFTHCFQNGWIIVGKLSHLTLDNQSQVPVITCKNHASP